MLLTAVLATTAFTTVAPPAARADEATPTPTPAPSSPAPASRLGDALDALESLRDDLVTPDEQPAQTPAPDPGDGAPGEDVADDPGQGEGEGDDQGTPTPEPTDTAAPPTENPTPTPTPTPTPDSTPAPTPAGTPAPTPAPTHTPAPTTPPRAPAANPPLTIHDAPGDYPGSDDALRRAEQEQADADAAAAAAQAAAEAAARASAARVAAFTAAQSDLTHARAAYDDAKLAYASVKARYDEATDRARLLHGMAEDAAATAAQAGRVIATITRAMAQQRSGTAAVDAFLDGSSGGLLYRLGTLDKLSHLSGSLATIRERSEAEQQRANSLGEQDVAAQQAVLAIPLDQARTDMEAAHAAVDAAQARVDSLRAASTAGVLGMSPLPAHKPDTGQLSAQGWVLPAVGAITDHFGPRPDKPLPDVGDYHYGTDIGASCDAGVYAATSGTVVSAGALGTYGNWILIDHGNGVQTGYAHLATGETLVAVGDTVIAGQVIAGVGSTGASTGCHLHFEVRIDGSRVDPQPFLAKRGIVLGK